MGGCNPCWRTISWIMLLAKSYCSTRDCRSKWWNMLYSEKNTGSDIPRACIYWVCAFVFNWVLFSRYLVFHIIHMKPPTLNYPSYVFFLKQGYPQLIHFKRMFHSKPSSYWGTPHQNGTPFLPRNHPKSICLAFRLQTLTIWLTFCHGKSTHFIAR